MSTRVAPSPSRVSGARRAPAALLSTEDSTLPDLRRLGCQVLGVNPAPMSQDVPTRERGVSLILAPLWIERVAESIAQEGKAQHRETDRQHREEQHMGVGLDVP